MSAELIILPVIRVERSNLDACEQRDREIGGYLNARIGIVPPRTRPLLVVDNRRENSSAARRLCGK